MWSAAVPSQANKTMWVRGVFRGKKTIQFGHSMEFDERVKKETGKVIWSKIAVNPFNFFFM